MQELKMWHKNAGRENAGKESTAQKTWAGKCETSQYGKRTDTLCNIKWIIIYWQNKNNHVVFIFRTTV